MTEKQHKEFIRLVKLLLHACRDCMRTRKEDTRNFRFNVNDGYYGEVHGMFRALEVLEYNSGVEYYHYTNDLDAWKHELEKQVLDEEGFYTRTHRCDFCTQHFGKDGAGRTRKDLVNV